MKLTLQFLKKGSKGSNVSEYQNNNEEFLMERYQEYLKLSEAELKEDFEFFKVEYKFWSIMHWKAGLNINVDQTFVPYMLSNGKFYIADKIRKFYRGICL